MALYQTLGTVELECDSLMAAHTPKFTNHRKLKLFNKARAKKEASLNGDVTEPVVLQIQKRWIVLHLLKLM